MKQTFHIAKELYRFLSYKGIPFPMAWFPFPKGAQPDNGKYQYNGNPFELKTHSDLGAVLRKQDSAGRFYFMPVVFIHNNKEYEIPNAVIGYTGKKNIVETQMVGRKGSVKELINLSDYEINIAGAAIAPDFPEAQLKELIELYEINEALTLKCALTDLFMDSDDKVVIKSIELNEMKAAETLQTVKISCVTDRAFELIIE